MQKTTIQIIVNAPNMLYRRLSRSSLLAQNARIGISGIEMKVAISILAIKFHLDFKSLFFIILGIIGGRLKHRKI